MSGGLTLRAVRLDENQKEKTEPTKIGAIFSELRRLTKPGTDQVGMNSKVEAAVRRLEGLIDLTTIETLLKSGFGVGFLIRIIHEAEFAQMVARDSELADGLRFFAYQATVNSDASLN